MERKRPVEIEIHFDYDDSFLLKGEKEGSKFSKNRKLFFVPPPLDSHNYS